MIASRTVDRVPQHTAEWVNRRIEAQTRRNVAYFREHPDEIPARLAELEAEWDVERALATGSSCLSLLGLTLVLSGWRRWLYLPLGVQGFYLQHTVQGWCPPLPVLRRVGFRTPAEIDAERCALRGLLPPDEHPAPPRPNGDDGSARRRRSAHSETGSRTA